MENNNSEFYRLLGVDQFGEYISTCLSDMLINTLGSVLVFAASYIVIHLVDPLAEPVVQTAYYMWLKSDGRRDRRACRRISAFVACRIYSQLFYGDSNGADAGSAGKQQYLAFTDLQI